MKNSILLILLIISTIVGCHSSLSIGQLNNKFVRCEKPLSKWDKDLLETRTEAFERIKICLDSFDTLFLIEYYDVESIYYYGVLYLSENHYFHFSREGFGEEVDLLNKELTKTEKFIIEELQKGDLDNIKVESRKTDVMSPSSLYITVAQKGAKRHILYIRLEEFYVD